MHDFDPRHERGWRKFEAFARRGFRGFPFSGMPNFDGLEGNFRIGRMLASGDLRLVALYLIEQQPRHGYDLIKAIEEKTAGFYTPSPGIVYPALTFLDEAGYVSSSAEGNKKEYAITDEGRAHLASNRTAVESTLDYLGKIGRRWAEVREGFSGNGPRDDDGPRAEGHEEREFRFRGGPGNHGPAGHGHGPGGPGFGSRPDRDIPGVLPEVNDARRALKAAIAEGVEGDEDAQRRLAEILTKAARKIRELHKPEDGDIDV
jgi:DNA-binding PadR family transcriptional regulator